MTCTKPFKRDGFGHGLIPCGRCMACRIQKLNEWKTRLINELEYHEDSCFITLTYDDLHLPKDLSVDIKEVQKFLKRLRKGLGEQKIKIYYVGEYGEEGLRPHYHIIVLGWQPNLRDLAFIGLKGTRKLYASRFLRKLWTLGENNVGTLESSSISYVLGYITKKLYGEKAKEVYGGRKPPFAKMSKGLGLRYALDRADYIKENLTVTVKGKDLGLPMYYAKKLEIGNDVLKNRASIRKWKIKKELKDLPLDEQRYRLEGDRIQREANLKAKERFKK